MRSDYVLYSVADLFSRHGIRDIICAPMVNVSGETPRNRNLNTDIPKSVVGGDWVTGRAVYERPMKFQHSSLKG